MTKKIYTVPYYAFWDSSRENFNGAIDNRVTSMPGVNKSMPNWQSTITWWFFASVIGQGGSSWSDWHYRRLGTRNGRCIHDVLRTRVPKWVMDANPHFRNSKR